MEGFAAPGATPPAVMPAALALAATASRPRRTPGAQPRAVILLVEIDVQGLAA